MADPVSLATRAVRGASSVLFLAPCMAGCCLAMAADVVLYYVFGHNADADEMKHGVLLRPLEFGGSGRVSNSALFTLD